MLMILYTLACFVVLAVMVGFMAALMWIYSVVQYHRDGWYAARYGRPHGWPFTRRSEW